MDDDNNSVSLEQRDVMEVHEDIPSSQPLVEQSVELNEVECSAIDGSNTTGSVNSAALTQQFENTLAHFLSAGDSSPTTTDADAKLPQTSSDPITSVFDLLSEETRNYLRQHNTVTTDDQPWLETRRDPLPQPVREKRVRMQEPLSEQPLPEPSAEADEALSNYMHTMQQFIGRTFRPMNKHSGSPLVSRKRESAPTFKDKFGYEPIENVARSLDPAVRRWLIGLRLPNLTKYLELFEANEVDRESLKLLTEGQLRRMGINKLGPLNKMLHSIRVLRNCEPPKMPPPPSSPTKKVDSSPRASSAPNSARISEPKSASKRPLSARSRPSPRSPGVRRERCLLRLLEAHDSGTGEKNKRAAKRTVFPSARSAVSGAVLVQKASREIERAAQKYQSKLDQDAQRREQEEKMRQELQEKREKFAADYKRRQLANRVEARERAAEQEAHKTTSAPTTPRTPRKQTAFAKKEPRATENSSDPNAVETQMGIDAQKPNLVCEDQLNDLELHIQNLVDVQDLRQLDSRSLISCIDQLQLRLHAIQTLVAQQKAREASQSPPKPKRAERTPREAPQSTPRSSDLPGHDLTQTDLKFSDRDYLGEGCFTQVFRGRFRRREVAVKRLKTPLTTDEKIRLANEVNNLMELQHENVARVLGCIVKMKFPLLIVELGRGGSLAQLLQKPDPLDHCAFFQIAADICAGLSYLHAASPLSPRTHLRLTSRNVLLDLGLRARLGDVGLSRLRHECARSMREAGAARSEWSQLPWMAPEVLGGEEAGPPADIYSFGVLLWEMLMRQTPYDGLTMFQMIERIRDGPALSIPDACPVGLRSLIRRCWQLRRVDRPSVLEVLVSVNRLRVPVSWQTVLQSAGLAPTGLCDIAFFRRLVAAVLDVPPPPEDDADGVRRPLPPGGPCGILSSPLPDLDLAPVTRIEELAQKIAAFIQQKSEDTPFGSRSSPLTEELSARGAVWDRKT